MVLLLFAVRRYFIRKTAISDGPTWGCGYVATNSRQQYTASSFIRSYSKLFQFVLQIHKDEREVKGIFPAKADYTTHPYDKVEKWLIDKPLRANKSFMGSFVFLQNGKLQFYILYGIIFIITVISIPLVYNNILIFIEFLKQL
jgi:hypothetical protein